MGDWKYAHIGFEGDTGRLGGISVWKAKWRRVEGEPIMLPNPASTQKTSSFEVYEIGEEDHPIRFAACELSAGVWGFYVPR
jgi:hypothetical protein